MKSDKDQVKAKKAIAAAALRGTVVELACGAAALALFYLVATISKAGGLALIAGFTAVVVNLIRRFREQAELSLTPPGTGEERPDTSEDTARGRGGFIGRTAFGGAGRPAPTLWALAGLQAVVVLFSALTGLGPQAWVLTGFFLVQDAVLWRAVTAMRRSAKRN